MHLVTLSAPLSQIKDARRVLDETMSSKTILKIRCVLKTATICCKAFGAKSRCCFSRAT